MSKTKDPLETAALLRKTAEMMRAVARLRGARAEISLSETQTCLALVADALADHAEEQYQRDLIASRWGRE